jgi:hypothetical protein
MALLTLIKERGLAARRRLESPYLSYVVPVLYFTFIMWLQPVGHLGDPKNALWHGRTVYDDFDWTAIALRSLNAAHGRVPGLQADPCSGTDPTTFGPITETGQRTSKRRYFLEYPAPVLWLFSLAFTVAPDMKTRPIPAEILDQCQGAVVFFEPKTESDVSIMRGLRLLIRSYEAIALIFLLALIWVLHGGYKDFCSGPMPELLFVLPAFLYFSLNRFDIVPTLLVALSVACLSRGYIGRSGACLAAGAVIKVFPIFVAPLFIRYFASNLRRAAWWTSAFCLTVLAILGIAVSTSGVAATLAPFRYQLSRHLEGWTIYGPVVPKFLGTQNWNWFRLGVVVLIMGAMCWTPIRSLDSLLRRGAVILIVFISLQVFFSPQWIVWLAPFLIPLACINRRLIPWLFGIDMVMYASVPLLANHYGHLGDLIPAAFNVALYARVSVLAALVALLIRWDREVNRRKAV